MRDSQPIASKLELSPCAVSVLGQLFVEGPTSDDNITSKAGRCDLVSAGRIPRSRLVIADARWRAPGQGMGPVFAVRAPRSTLVLESARLTAVGGTSIEG